SSNAKPLSPYSYLLMSEERHSRPMGLIGWSSARVRRRDCPFRFTRTCCDIVRDTSSQAMATIHEPFRITLGIAVSATRFDIRNWRRRGSRTFGGISRPPCRLGYREQLSRMRDAKLPRRLRTRGVAWTGPPVSRARYGTRKKYLGP